MKILTVGECPYILSQSGRINSDIIKTLVKKNEVKSAVWNLDITWFMSDEDEKYRYEVEDKKICELYPLPSFSGQCVTALYDFIKEYKPELIIFIGSYESFSTLYAIKNLEIDAFKLISIFLIDSFPVNEKYLDLFTVSDYSIFTTERAFEELNRIGGVECKYIPYGPNLEKFKNLDYKKEKFRIMSSSKNASTSSLASFMLAVSQIRDSEIEPYLHTPYSIVGEYDIDLLMKRYNLRGYLNIPQGFVSLNDGLSDEEMNVEYNKSDVIIDVSVRSSTGLSILEGMAAGCIPLVTRVGALEEIVSKLPEECQFFVRSILYIGDNEKEYQIVDIDDLSNKILYLKELKQNNRKEFEKISRIVSKEAKKYSNEIFKKNIEEIVKDIEKNEGTISLDII